MELKVAGIVDRIFGQPFEVVVAHAALANKHVDLSEERPLSRFITLRANDGAPLDPEDYFVIKASGRSLAEHGVEDGAMLVARRVTPDLLPRLADGALVVVHGRAKDSNTGRRLRVFAGLDDNVVRFSDGSGGLKRRSRPANEVVGVVTHTLPGYATAN